MSIHEILKQYWGFDTFRPVQEDIIKAVLKGTDTLALLPTGGGKSVCYQVPGLAKEGLCLVVSPLIALIKDQVESLKKKGIPTLAIYSGMHYGEIRKTLQNAIHGPFKFLYVSPERLETSLFREYLPGLSINLIAIDEAHCISQWGYDFRPTYLRIAALREYLPNVPVLAVTASATQTVQDDICLQLKFPAGHLRFSQSFERPNLSYSVFNTASKQNKLLDILRNVPGTSIVYCKSRKRTKEIADLLNLNKINADHYHAGLTNDERTRKQENWFNNKTRVMACTNAFGMGIDKPDVRTVVHMDIPDCLENYYQEAGRAGRDGKRSYAVLLYAGREPDDLLEQGDIRFPSEDEIKKVYIGIMNHLQIAAGSGEGTSFDFDLIIFCSAFKLNVVMVTYALKALEQEALISFNEVFYKPSTLVFTTGRKELADLEQQHPELDYLVKGLLRSYEGILDFPSTIHEKKLAGFLKTDYSALIKDLAKLHEWGILDYNPQKDSPQIVLLRNRMYTDNYVFRSADYRKRKLLFEQRLSAMINYLRWDEGCRSSYISRYFNAPGNASCGICDNCIAMKNTALSKDEFATLSGQILALAKETPISIKLLLERLKGVSKIKAWKVIDYLLAEKELKADDKGTISG